ncbi:MAG: DUF488 domain-containing protein [Alphaproteobacteria bacterium]
MSHASDDRKTIKRTGPSPKILTIGHSTHPIDEFIALLRAHGVTDLIDVRTVPRSRHNPQFNRDRLPASLARAGIEYVHRPDLGGLRHPRKDSRNTGWRNLGFRGFADYMERPEFTAALASLMARAEQSRMAIMCAEAVPWRCHRSLIADALTARGIPVGHIMNEHPAELHRLTPFARNEAGNVTYPPEAENEQGRLF